VPGASLVAFFLRQWLSSGHRAGLAAQEFILGITKAGCQKLHRLCQLTCVLRFAAVDFGTVHFFLGSRRYPGSKLRANRLSDVLRNVTVKAHPGVVNGFNRPPSPATSLVAMAKSARRPWIACPRIGSSFTIKRMLPSPFHKFFGLRRTLFAVGPQRLIHLIDNVKSPSGFCRPTLGNSHHSKDPPLALSRYQREIRLAPALRLALSELG